MTDEIDPLISVPAAARAIGLDRTTLGKQVRAGVVRSHNGKVRLSEVLADRAANIDLDEIDKYPPSAGAEGDPLKLAEERASTYLDVGRGKLVRACSPTVKGTSRIGREYQASDQRRCFVACPQCDHAQVLTWKHVKWQKLLKDSTVTYDVQDGQEV